MQPAGPTPGERATGRVESFSDGVFAVLITLMAFELKAPVGHDLHDLRGLLPSVLVYLLSFTFIGIYWNNHHELLRTARSLTGWVLWANLHTLFWLSLIPVLTEWTGRQWHHSAPAATYAAVALCSGAAFSLLRVSIRRADGGARSLAAGIDWREVASTGAYAVALGVAWISPLISYAVFVAVALMWIVPRAASVEPA